MGKRRPQNTRSGERRANAFRHAWNRIGKMFRLRPEEVLAAKANERNPHKILRHPQNFNRDTVRRYIEVGDERKFKYDNYADYLVDREVDRLTEIAGLEMEGLTYEEAVEIVGEHWW